MNEYFVYMLATKSNQTIYTGVTNNLMRRIFQHKSNFLEDNDSFTKRYKICKLVYYEIFNEIHLAIEREKQIKKWNRKWKIRLIEKLNPNWVDLYEPIIDPRHRLAVGQSGWISGVTNVNHS